MCLARRQGVGCVGCAIFSQDTLYLTRDLMEDSAVPSNLSAPRRLSGTLPQSVLQFFRMKRDRTRASTLKWAKLKPLSPLCFVWAAYLVLREVSWSFIRSPRTPKPLSSE